jgi:energy-coupling factor transporter transmembrane protein EcfT
MFLFIYCFYYFLKFYEKNFVRDDNSINFFIIIVFLAVTTKISNISLMFLLFIILFSNKKYNLFNFSNVFVAITSLFWLTRSFFISGCFVFPIKKTCLDTQWSDPIQTEYIGQVIQSYTRDTRLRAKWTDFDYTLYTNDWFIPWFKDYFLNTALLKISSVIFIISLILFVFILFSESFKKNKKKEYKKNFYFTILIFYFIAIYIWLKAPEVRFASGMIISLPCILLAIVIDKFEFNKYFSNKRTLFIVFGLFFLILIKHSEKFNFEHLILINKGNIQHNNIEKIATVNGVEIYQSMSSQCGDFPKICVNKKKQKYEIVNKLNYRIFVSEKK